MSRSDPGPGEAEERRKEAGTVLLGEGEDGPVRKRVQDRGEKVGGLSGEGCLEGEEEGVVREETVAAALQGAG